MMNLAPLSAGYVTYTGYALTKIEAEAYNRYTQEAERPFISPQAREFLLQQRHEFFTLCAESVRS